MLLSTFVLFTSCHVLAPLLLCHLRHACAQKPGSRWLIGDRDSHCGVICSRTQGKPVCGSDGRSYENSCELQRAHCKDKTLTLAHRGRCRGKNWVKTDQSAVPPTSASEARALEHKAVADGGQSKCRSERNDFALEQARRPQEAIFIPECNEDGTFAQVQCHTWTGYCWCVTNDGKPVSGSSAHNRTPVCSGSVTDKPPGQVNTGRKGELRSVAGFVHEVTLSVSVRVKCLLTQFSFSVSARNNTGQKFSYCRRTFLHIFPQRPCDHITMTYLI